MPASMHGTVVCTVVTSNYLHFALALVKSVRKIHSELPIVVCIADRVDRLPQIPDRLVEFVFADQLAIHQWPRFSFQYTAFELACALKPSVMGYCFSELNADRVVYLDADMQLYGPLNELADVTPRCSVMLTPHLLSPLPADNHLPSCETFTRAGAYNGGFLSINRGEAGLRFLRWWKSRMQKSCVVRLEDGLFVDQRPLDLVPGLFDGVYIHRRPGFHLAYWNLYGEQVLVDGDGYRLASGPRVTLFHFSGIDPENEETLSEHQDRLSLNDHPAVRSMIVRYIGELHACGRNHYHRRRYGYATLTDGTTIREYWRELIRQDHTQLQDVEDPFDVERYPDLPQRFHSIETYVPPPEIGRVRSVSKSVETAVKWMLGRHRKAA